VALRVPHVVAAGLATKKRRTVADLVSLLGVPTRYSWLSCHATFSCLESFLTEIHFFHPPRVLMGLNPGEEAKELSVARGSVSYWSGVLATQTAYR